MNSHQPLYLLFILSTVTTLINGDKFIGHYLKSKLRNYTISPSNGTDHKLWMKYLEKRLQIISLDPLRKRQIFSIMHYNKINLKRNILRRINFLCTNGETTFPDLVQHGTFGSICASSENGKEVNQCMHLQDTIIRNYCLKYTGKYDIIVKIFISVTFSS